MRRYLKLLATSAKYAGILVAGTATVGLTYLQYINSQVGPIDIDKQRFMKYHTEESKLSDS